MNKLKLYQPDEKWESFEKQWDKAAAEAAKVKPLQGLRSLPNMVGIAPETAKNLKWKSFWWMLTQDHDKAIRTNFLKKPFKYGWRFLRSLCQKTSFTREGDFFFYGIKDIGHFEQLLEDADNIFVLGFSYCHKPFECPSGRFTPECIHDPNNDICKQCFIGKAVNSMPPSSAIPLFIPTVHYIGGKIFEIAHANEGKQVTFLITACEMTLVMFGDWGNMVGIKGIGVRLDGRICNTMKAFELSERGIKPGLTVVLDDTQKKIMKMLQKRARALTSKLA